MWSSPGSLISAIAMSAAVHDKARTSKRSAEATLWIGGIVGERTIDLTSASETTEVSPVSCGSDSRYRNQISL